MKERLGALFTELVFAAVRFGRCNTRRHCFERLLFTQSSALLLSSGDSFLETWLPAACDAGSVMAAAETAQRPSAADCLTR
jgi:hypothetical protein